MPLHPSALEGSPSQQHVAVLGAGAWGTALAMHISQQHQVSLWARNSGHVSGMRKSRANPLYLGDFKFHDNLQVEDDLAAAIHDAEIVMRSAISCRGI